MMHLRQQNLKGELTQTGADEGRTPLQIPLLVLVQVRSLLSAIGTLSSALHSKLYEYSTSKANEVTRELKVAAIRIPVYE